MDRLLKKYSQKLIAQRLCREGQPLLGALDDEIIWSRESENISILEEVFAGLNINSILFSNTMEPFKSIIDYLAEYSADSDNLIHPDDTETRTFLHDIPVAENFTGDEIISGLKKRKGVIIPGRGIVTFGTVSAEQAFITFSSICFSCYVKFMTDFYFHSRGLIPMKGNPEPIARKAADIYGSFISEFSDYPEINAPYDSPSKVAESIVETGRLTVESGMVDSFFGNISVYHDDIIYISQTGTSLDELSGLIDPCPMDNSTTNAMTSSSEFSAHRSIFRQSTKKTILHGHPKYCVISSLLCDDLECPNRGKCHIACTRERMIEDVPIIPGEVGTGPTGIATTLPPAIRNRRGAIVFGHGLFLTGEKDFSDSFANLMEIEKICFNRYRELTGI